MLLYTMLDDDWAFSLLEVVQGLEEERSFEVVVVLTSVVHGVVVVVVVVLVYQRGSMPAARVRLKAGRSKK
jgi:hypothetical protein